MDSVIISLMNHWPDASDELSLLCNEEHPGLKVIAENTTRPVKIIKHNRLSYRKFLTWAQKNSLINFIMLAPSISTLAKGMIPNIPDTGEDKNAFLVVASMVGTTIFSGLFILRTTLVKEANWTMKDLNTQRTDALFSGL